MWPLIRKCPNGETWSVWIISTVCVEKRTQGSETSQYLEE
jgi:hypothetical protein